MVETLSCVAGKETVRRRIAGCFLVFFLLFLCAQNKPALSASVADSPDLEAYAADTMHVYAWANMVPPWLIEEFFAETGIRIDVSYYASTSAMHYYLGEGKMRCDLLLAPLASVPGLLRAGVIDEIDYDLLPEGLPDAIRPQLRSNSVDPGFRHIVPMYWGVNGILINTRLADPDPIESYADLLRPELRGKVLLPRDFRSVLSMALLMGGFSVNDFSLTHMDEVANNFSSLLEAGSIFTSAGVAEQLLRGNAAVAACRNKIGVRLSDAALVFKSPSEGSSLWLDGLMIGAEARNPSGAYKFVEFVLRPEVAARLSDELGLAVSVIEAEAYMQNRSLLHDPLVYMGEEMYSQHTFEMPVPDDVKDYVFSDWVRVQGTK